MANGFPLGFGQQAEDAFDQSEIERLMRLTYPQGVPQAPSAPQSPAVPFGRFNIPGAPFDAASIAILQQLQNARRPRNFGEGLVQGALGSLAGGRARGMEQRQSEFERKQKEADEATSTRRQAASTLATHRWTLARQAAGGGASGEWIEVTPEILDWAKKNGVAIAPGVRRVKTADLTRNLPLSVDFGGTTNPQDDARLERIVDGIERGDASPDIESYGRDSRVRTALTDKMLQRGLNPMRMAQKFNAEKVFLRSANGTIALRGMRNVVNARESLDYVEQLLDNSIGVIPRGRVTVFNKLAMNAAANGAFGSEAEVAARQLKAQVAAIRFELSNIYMGGTAPTDQAVKKAMDVIDSNWSEAGLRGAIKLARRDLGIRVNAIKEVGPISLDVQGGVVGEPQPVKAKVDTAAVSGLKGNQAGADFLKRLEELRKGKKP